MRLFVAVLPPAPALQELADAVGPLHELPGAERLRWAGVDGWHLTLAFLGEVPGARVPELGELLARAAAASGSHRLRLAGGGSFGDRVLWVGVDGETWALKRLAESVRAAVEEFGIEPDEHLFHPHLTLARSAEARHRHRSDRRAAVIELHALAAALAPFRGSDWPVAELHLMKSDLGGGPARYQSVGAWQLVGWST